MRFLALTFLVAAIAAAQPRTVVVELFTSEGCSSCPPADNLLARLPQMLPGIEVIPLGEHVDYWNSLGWRDRFSAALYSQRQQDYARWFHLDSPYTPEMVVDGQVEFNGSDENRARREIAKAAQGPAARLAMSLAGGGVHFKVDQLPQGARNVDVFLAVTESNLESDVARGENSGRRLRHIGVVRSLATVGHFDARKSPVFDDAGVKLNLKPEWRAENLKLVLFVEDRASGQIIGAATLKP